MGRQGSGFDPRAGKSSGLLFCLLEIRSLNVAHHAPVTHYLSFPSGRCQAYNTRPSWNGYLKLLKHCSFYLRSSMKTSFWTFYKPVLCYMYAITYAMCMLCLFSSHGAFDRSSIIVTFVLRENRTEGPSEFLGIKTVLSSRSWSPSF